jgi:hypothetical protein
MENDHLSLPGAVLVGFGVTAGNALARAFICAAERVADALLGKF